MTTGSDLSPRGSAIAAADMTCPRCGSPRGRDQHYCLDCGLRLPAVEGTLPSLRRRWLRRFGWYPGDWVWTALLALLVAAGGAAAAIVVSDRRASTHPLGFDAATSSVPLHEPRPVAAARHRRAGSRKGRRTGTLPTPPEPGVPNGRLRWPADKIGWTIVLVSYPKTTGRVEALRKASAAARSGLGQVGILDSSRFASLQPGYFVVFTGIYASKPEADSALQTARGAGFAGAYSRQIAR